jgi:hypothetical protein
MPALKTGIGLIASERQRQITVEGWDEDHDTQHDRSELAVAAACYAVVGTHAKTVTKNSGEDAWPWGFEYEDGKMKKHDRLRRLAIAGALIAAEIDRILAEGGH